MSCLGCMRALQVLWLTGHLSFNQNHQERILVGVKHGHIYSKHLQISSIFWHTYAFTSSPSTCISLPSLPHSFSLSRSLSLQWSYGFYLIHLQGKQGFQFFCKTEETKRKWMEQFDMAMWVWLHTPPIKRKATVYHILWIKLKHDLDDLISKHSLLFTSRSNIKPERATANQHNFQMHTFEKNTNCRACKMLLR